MCYFIVCGDREVLGSLPGVAQFVDILNKLTPTPRALGPHGMKPVAERYQSTIQQVHDTVFGIILKSGFGI